jgi:WD40 repeat protein
LFVAQGDLVCLCASALLCSQLWRLSQDSPVAVFKHDHEVFTIKWSPAPAAEGQGQLLATASMDKTVRLFDSQSGRYGWLPVGGRRQVLCDKTLQFLVAVHGAKVVVLLMDSHCGCLFSTWGYVFALVLSGVMSS